MNQLDLTLLNVAAATVLQTFTDINISYHFKERIFLGFYTKQCSGNHLSLTVHAICIDMLCY